MLPIIIVGGGAAGFFSAIHCKMHAPEREVIIMERARDVLEKVRISGGGRCNVTHACFDPRELSKHYPRGEKELIGPFNRFACGDTISWYDERGVELKIEDDGRMFPTTDNSETIAQCLIGEAKRLGVQVRCKAMVKSIDHHDGIFELKVNEDVVQTDILMLAPGSAAPIWKQLERLGLPIVKPVPSLFTFNIKDTRISDLPGLSVPNAGIKVIGQKLEAHGPLLITHWGLSGPAILRLSAWGARALYEQKYRFEIQVNWIMQGQEDTLDLLRAARSENTTKQVHSHAQFQLPKRLWRSLCDAAGIGVQLKWADLSKKQLNKLAQELSAGRYQVDGKSTFKEEFVTAGGVDLKAMELKRFATKAYPNLFIAGECLNIDAITGGFNFQAAWTGGYLAGLSMADLAK